MKWPQTRAWTSNWIRRRCHHGHVSRWVITAGRPQALHYLTYAVDMLKLLWSRRLIRHLRALLPMPYIPTSSVPS